MPATSQQQVGSRGRCAALLLLLLSVAPRPGDTMINIPSKLKSPPVITAQPKSITTLSADDITLTCEATGNPPPTFRWVRDGVEFDPSKDPDLSVSRDSGTFSLTAKDGPIHQYQGRYNCYASNKLGTAVSNEAHIVTENTPTLQEEKKVIKVEEGESVVLPCNPPNSTMAQVKHWMDKRLQHIQQNERVIQGRDGNLYFSHVIAADSREDYTCNTHFPSAHIIVLKEPIKLTVVPSNSVRNRRPQMMRPTGSRSSYLVLSGQSLELECIVQGLPTPSIQWIRKDRVLSESHTSNDNYNRVLRFMKISESDSGEYQCTATNVQGMITHTYNITVEAAPYWTKEPKSQLYTPGETVKLECNSDGIPSPEVTWSINGNLLTDIDPDPRRSVKHGVLTLNNVELSDTAVYQCKAANKHGSILINAYVNVIDRPDPPTQIQMTEPKERSVTLSWTPGEDHNSPVLEYLIEFEETGSERKEWEELSRVSGSIQQTTLPLKPFISYRFRIIAINDIGKSDPSKETEAYSTPAAPPDSNPEGVRSDSIDLGTLVITWKELDRRSFNGPDFRYKMMWRKVLGSGPSWHTKYITSPPFIVTDVGNFSAFDIKVQAVNEMGEGPEPKSTIGYSGEDYPLEAPLYLRVSVINRTAAVVTWDPVNKETVRGRLQGYKIYLLYFGPESRHLRWERVREGKSTNISVVMTDGDEMIVGDLQPYSYYSLAVSIFNYKGEGPQSKPLYFYTPEGVPGPPSSLLLESTSETEMILRWTPPIQPNGVLNGYILQYQQIDNEDSAVQVKISDHAKNHFTLKLDPRSRYRFYLRGYTAAGEGLPIIREGATTQDGGPTLDLITE